MQGRWMLAGVALLAVTACSGGESEWVQKCVQGGKSHAACACFDKELKPEWRDFALMSDATPADVRANMPPDAFVALSAATSKCMAPS